MVTPTDRVASRIDALQNRVAIVRAVRDLAAVQGDAVSIRQIADAAGVSPATLYRHFDGKRSLLDSVSVYRWSQMKHAAEVSAPSHPDEPQGIRRIARIMDLYTRMTTADAAFIHALGLRPGHDPSGIVPLRGAFDPSFQQFWTDGQRRGEIRVAASAQDAIEMAGAIREPGRRLQMLTLLIAGIATPDIDPDEIVRELYLRRK